jgi:hypothetical protein
LAPYGGKWFVLISALMFGLFHANMYQIPFAFVLGLFFAYTMYRTGNVLIPIFFHFLNNLISSIGSFFLGTPIGGFMISIVVLAVVGAGGVACFILVLTGRFKKDIIFEASPSIAANKNLALKNPGIVLAISMTTIATVLALFIN